MSGKARERESAKKMCKGKVCGGADRGKSEGQAGNTQGRRKCGEQIHNGKQNGGQSTLQGRTGEERQRNTTGQKGEKAETDRGATKERKGAEFLKDLHLRAGFGIMER